MKEVDEDAWAAVRRVLDWKRPTLTASEANDLTTVLSLLPEALTNPQPALPTEPGVYSVPARSQAHLGHWHTDGIELHYLNAEGNWCDVGWGNALVSEKRAFTRLVPERPQVTRQQIASAIDEVVNKWADTGGALASPLTERIAGLVQGAHQ